MCFLAAVLDLLCRYFLFAAIVQPRKLGVYATWSVEFNTDFGRRPIAVLTNQRERPGAGRSLALGG